MYVSFGLDELTESIHWLRLNDASHDDVIKWKHFPRYLPFLRGIHRSPVNSPHKGQWRGALMFSLICAQINGWENNREAGDLRRHRAHYDVIVMHMCQWIGSSSDQVVDSCLLGAKALPKPMPTYCQFELDDRWNAKRFFQEHTF